MQIRGSKRGVKGNMWLAGRKLKKSIMSALSVFECGKFEKERTFLLIWANMLYIVAEGG
jgi:hypothetical protein